MKTTLIALAALIAISAHAHGSQEPPKTTPTPTPAPVTATAASAALGLGVGIGIGLGGTAAGGSVTGSGNGTAQVLGSGNSTYNAAPVAGGALDLAGARIGSDISVPKQAPSMSMTAPQQPIASCRIGISLFGSSSGGGGGGGIPAGNDATCLAGAKLAAMERAGGFSVESKQRVACTIEGMAELAECKRLKGGERAEAILSGRPVASNSLQLLP